MTATDIPAARMNRCPTRWENMDPSVVAAGSQAQVFYALQDAQADIRELVAEIARLRAARNAVASTFGMTGAEYEAVLGGES